MLNCLLLCPKTCVMDYLRKKQGKPRACVTCGKILKNNWDEEFQYVFLLLQLRSVN